MSLDKRVLLVTGGSRGIGAAVAKLAVQRGYAVCVNYRRNRDAAEGVVAEIVSQGGEGLAVASDIAEEGGVLALFEAIDRRFGRLDALVNNAGVLERQQRLDEIDLARLHRVFATNVFGAILCAREAVRRMSTRYGGRGGAIVNVSSIAARTGSPNEYVDYAASKGALDSLTVGLAAEVAAEGVRVNAVRPGFIHTGMHADGGEPDRVARLAPLVPMRRGGEPGEVASAILWLLSEEAAYVTGSLMDVAGGRR